MASQVHPGGIGEGGMGGGGVEKALCFQPGASEGMHFAARRRRLGRS